MGRGDNNKRLIISVEVLNPKRVLEDQLSSKLGCLFHLCCGVVAFGTTKPQKYCFCCCVCLNSDDVIAAVAEEVSYALADEGILNEIESNTEIGTNKFCVIVRKMNSAKQVVAKKILEKKIQQRMEEVNIQAKVIVTREDGHRTHKTTKELLDWQKVANEKYRLIEQEEKKQREKEEKEREKNNSINSDNSNRNSNKNSNSKSNSKSKTKSKNGVNNIDDINSDEDDRSLEINDIEKLDLKMSSKRKFNIMGNKKKRKEKTKQEKKKNKNKNKGKKNKGNTDVGDSYQQLPDTNDAT